MTFVTRRYLLVAALALASLPGCDQDDCCTADAADLTPRDEVASIAATANRDIDMLFVVDDSVTMADKQTNLKTSFPSFINTLSTMPGGFPNVHIGVVTTDLGTRGAEDGMPGPSIGSGGAGTCAGTGKAGNLVTNGTSLLAGKFISDVATTGGTREKNYTSALPDAFSAIASVGAAGCGFEQPLEAAKLALDNNPANIGFLRAAASLAIIFVTDEDDCSLAHSSLLTTETTTLGPLQSFRCTRYGVTCDQGGTTAEAMNQIGSKSGCHSNESSAYLTRVDSYATFFKSLKPDPSMVMVAALAGPTTPFDVQLDSTSGIPALAHSCQYTASTGLLYADPPARLAQLVSRFSRSALENICGQDVVAPLTKIANQVRGMVGDTCLSKSVAMPLDCVASDTSAAGTRNLPMCGGSNAADCFDLVTDPVACLAFDHLRVEIKRSTAAAADTVTSIKCTVP